MTSYEADGAIFVVHEGKTTKVPYKRSVMDSGRTWFSLYPERGTDKAIIEEATACLRREHDGVGIAVYLGEAGPDSRMYKRGWTINLIDGKPVEKKPQKSRRPKKRHVQQSDGVD